MPHVGPSDISAILAVMDLKLVRGLRAALQDDIQHGVHPLGPAPQKILPRKVHEPDPRIEPRKVVHPTPYFEPRPIHHPEPKFAPHEDLFPPATSPLPEDPGSKCVIQPPWKVRPWETPVPTKLEVKVVQLRPDIVHKGTLIDFFC